MAHQRLLAEIHDQLVLAYTDFVQVIYDTPVRHSYSPQQTQITQISNHGQDHYKAISSLNPYLSQPPQ
jgi:hypothetical protein